MEGTSDGRRPTRARRPPPRYANAVPLSAGFDDEDERPADADSLGEDSLSDFEPEPEDEEDAAAVRRRDSRISLSEAERSGLSDEEGGLEFGDSGGEEDQAMMSDFDDALDKEMLKDSQQWYSVQGNGKTPKNTTLTHLSSSERRSLAQWKQIAQQRRENRLGDEEAEDVEVEDDEIRGLTDAFGGTIDDVNGWNEALHKDKGPAEADDEDMDDEAFEQDLREASGFRRKRQSTTTGRRRRAPREQTLSAEVRSLLREANNAFIMSDIDLALEKLREVIRQNNMVRSAWATMALCYAEKNEHEKQLQCRVIEAHLTPHPLQLWIELAELSQTNGYVEQTLYCLSKAISSSEDKDRSDVMDVMWQRTQVLLAMGDKRRAVGAFSQMLRYRPHHQLLIHNVIPLANELGMFRKAIQILENCAEWNMRTFPDPTDCMVENEEGVPVNEYTYETSEMVTLADLYFSVDRPAQAIDTLRRGQRWLQGRMKETFWDALEDDREYDTDKYRAEREGDYGRQVNLADCHDIDPEFRIRLGLARAKLGDVAEAQMHFEVWRENADVVDNAYQYGQMIDEMVLMGDYMKDDRPKEAKEVYKLAKDLMTDIINERHADLEAMEGQELSEEQTYELQQDYRRMAICCMSTKDYEQAIVYLTDVVTNSPDDLDSKLRLADAYGEMNDTRRAVELITEVMQAKREMQSAMQSVNDRLSEEVDSQMATGSDNFAQSLSFFAEMSQRSKSSAGGARQTARGAKEQMIRLEAASELEAKKVLERLKGHLHSVFVERWWHVDHLMSGDPTRRVYGSNETIEERTERFAVVSDWLDDMEYLVNMFIDTPQLYPRDRSKRFAGLFRHSRKRGDQIDRKARELLNRIGNAMIDETVFLNEVEQMTFRGINLDEWVQLIMQYAFVLTKVGDYGVAKAVLRRAMTSIVVWKDAERSQSLHLCLTACALYVGRWRDVIDEYALRTLPHRYQFHNEALRVLAVVANGGGNAGRRALATASNLKFFLRRSRIHEALVQGSMCVYNYSRHRWVVHDKLFEHTKSNIDGDESEGGDEDDEDDEDSSQASPSDDEQDTRATSQQQRLHISTAKSNDPRRKLLINSKEADAQTVWREVKSMANAKRIIAVDDCKDAPPSQYNPANDVFYAGILLTSSNGIPSMGYWLRVFARFRNDALVCLACAISCLGRATNRQVDNRHQVVMEAFAFLHLYRTIRNRDSSFTRAIGRVKNEHDEGDERHVEADDPEVHYNFGRAAHQMGLLQMAASRYRAVLNVSDARRAQMRKMMDVDQTRAPVTVAPIHVPLFDCIAESAFALHLIYVTSGNPTLANAIVERHLRV